MNAIETIRFPFLGAREDGEPFEYLLLDVSHEKARIAIYKWMVNRTNLSLKEKVHLFIPVTLTPYCQWPNNSPCEVVKMEREPEGQFYDLSFNHEIPINKDTNLPSKQSSLKMLLQYIKDSLILKQGILVYLKHLAPYFSRIIDYSQKDYQIFKQFIFDDFNNKIKKNEEALKNIYESLKTVEDPKDILIFLNLEDLRENIESEVIVDLFLLAFANLESRDELLTLLKESKYESKLKPVYYYMNYLIVIKDLEKRLYSNYNQIVLIYLDLI